MTNLFKMIFYTTLFMGTMISISSYSWLGTWMGLEINLLSFIPLMNLKNNSYSSESSIKYFLIQSIASSMFLFSIILIMMNKTLISHLISMNNYIMIMINSSLLTKLGCAPFHFWFPEIIEGMNWLNSLILMTWQKIAPFMLLSYTINSLNFIIMIIIMSTMIGSIMGFNQTSMRKIMAYSSINHMGWMISSFIYSNSFWMMYLIIYSYMSISLIYMFNYFKIFYMKQMYNFMNKNMLTKFFLNINLLSLGGLPPFLGFLPKWFIIQSLSNKFMIIILFMIMMTLITLFFYLRIMYMSMMIIQNEFNFIIMNKNLPNLTMMTISFISINGLMLFTLIFNLI